MFEKIEYFFFINRYKIDIILIIKYKFLYFMKLIILLLLIKIIQIF